MQTGGVYIIGGPPPDVSRQMSDEPDLEEKVEDKATGCCLWLPSTSVLPSSLTATPVYDEYGNKALGMNIVSTALILFDYGSDISVAFWLRKEKDSDFFMACTILLIVLPLIVVNLFSLVWYSQVSSLIMLFTHTGGFVQQMTERCRNNHAGPPGSSVWVCPSKGSHDQMASQASASCSLYRTRTCGRHHWHQH